MYYDQSKADKVVKFISGLRHVKGRQWANRPFTFIPWQEKDVIRPFFGTMNDDGTRQYRTCYIEVPKKNGKSELASAVANYCLFADGELGAEVYAAAGDLEQASIVFNSAEAMVRMNPVLYERSQIIPSRKRIVVARTNSVFIALSKEHLTKHGFNPSCIVIDELHTHKKRDMYDVLVEGTDAAREQQVVFIITTAGIFDKNSIAWEVHDYALKVQAGIIEDPTFLPVIYSAPDDADWGSEQVWKDANPSLGHILDIKNLRDHYEQIKHVPARQNNFRRLRLDQWVSQITRWMPMEYWDVCNKGPINIEALRGRKCWAGLDLATTTDICAFVLVFKPEEDDGDYVIVPYFWIPDEAMQDRARKDNVPYDMWVRSGLIEATPGNVIDYAFIIQTISDCAEMFDIQEIAFDRWGATKIVQDLKDMGFEPAYDTTGKELDDGRHLIQFGQGFGSMSSPTKELLNLALSKRLSHGGNPVLRWMADNAVVITDPAGNIKPDKGKSVEKIDGIVATIMGLDRAMGGAGGEDLLSQIYGNGEGTFAV